MKNTENYLALARWFKGGQGFANGRVIDKIGQQTRDIQQGRAYNFDFVDDRIVIADNPLMYFNQNWTFHWFREQTGVFSAGGFIKRIAGGNNMEFSIGQYSPDGGTNERLYLYFSANGSTWSSSYETTNLTPLLNQAVHYAFQRNGNDFTLWRNGIQVGSFTNASNVFDGTADWVFGNSADVAVGSRGNHWNIAFHNQSLFTTTFNPFSSDFSNVYSQGLVALYKCDEGGGSFAFDSSGNGIDGNLVNIAPATFHSRLTNGQGADWQNQVGYSNRFVNNGTTLNYRMPDWNTGGALQTLSFDYTPNVLGIQNLYISDFSGSTVCQVRINGTNRIDYFISYNGSTTQTVTSTTALIAGQRYTIVCQASIAGNFQRIYINGRLETTNTIPVGSTSIGGGNNSTFNYNGTMHRLYYSNTIWNFIEISDFQNRVRHYDDHTFTTRFQNYIPRDESNRAFDIDGQPLEYFGRVKYNADLRQSNCLTFDGTNDNITIPFNIDWSQNWTISFSYRSNATGTTQVLWSIGTGLFRVQMENLSADGQYRLLFSNNDNQENLLNIFPSTDWQFITIVKNGSNWTIYNNGIVTTTFTRNYTNSLTNLRLGTDSAISNFANGQMVDFKIYNSALTQNQIIQLYKRENVGTPVLDMPLQEGSGNRVFSRVGGHIGTMNNFDLNTCWANRQNVVHSNLIQGFDSFIFANSNTLLTVNDSADLRFGTNDFSIDFWFNTQTFALNGALFRSLISKNIGTNAGGWDIFLRDTDSSICLFSNVILLSSGTLQINTWYHIAITRTSGTLRMFINGVQVSSVANASNFNDTERIRVGRNVNANSFYLGYISHIRLINGTGGATFAIPTETSYSPTATNQSLLIRGLTDRNANPKTVTNSNGVLVYKPITATNPQTQSNYAGTWHNDAETTFVIPQAPQLIRRDTFTRFFNGIGTQIVQTFASMQNISGTKIIRGFQKLTPFLHKFDLSIKRFFN